MRTLEPPTTDPPELRTTSRRRVLIALVAVIALIGGVLWWAASGDDDDVTAGSTTTTAPSPSSTSTPTPSTTAPPPDPTAMWPVDASTRFSEPTAAARSFAVEFLGFDAPLVGELQQGDSRSGEIAIRPSDPGPVTTVFVRQLGPSDDWFVLGAATSDITVDVPAAHSTISSPVRVSGTALAFEGHVQVEVRQDGDDQAIGSGFVTGGGDVARPFTGVIEFDRPTAAWGALVFFTTSAKDGQVWQAAAMRVQLDQATGGAACGTYRPAAVEPGSGEMTVAVFFSCDTPDAASASVVEVQRVVPSSPRVLAAALGALLAGPTADERDAGVGSWFSDATASMLRSVTLADGHAVVDFGDLRSVIPNASASAGSQRLLAELDATVFQFPTVSSVEYRLEGSCDAWGEWLQMEPCERRTRG